MQRRKRIVQIVSDFAAITPDLSVLDIASLEGHYALELGARGARVLGIEGRNSNLQKAESERQRLGFENVRFVHDDVRNLSREKYGEFDCILCLGILYHLEAAEAVKLLEQVYEMCRGFAVIDTHFACLTEEIFHYRGKDYAGRFYTEYEGLPTPQAQENSNWASIGNTRSFWFTRPSLYNLLEEVGFSSVYVAVVPYIPDYASERTTLLAIKGQRENLHLAPPQQRAPWPEPIR